MNKKRTVFLYYLGAIIFVIALFLLFQALSVESVDSQGLFQAEKSQYALLNGSDSSSSTSSQEQRNQAADDVAQYTSAVQQDEKNVPIIGLIVLVAGFTAFISWIRILIGLARIQEWNWFFGVLAAGAVVMYVYLRAGPQLPKNKVTASSTTALQQLSQAAPTYPPPFSALEILLQRYARGEIDAATYQDMANRLKPSNTP